MEFKLHQYLKNRDYYIINDEVISLNQKILSLTLHLFLFKAMQCDPTCSNYHPCISPCPADTCDNLMHPKNQRLCNTDVCVEGCKLKDCPEGSVYSNSSYSECVPKSLCKPVCLEENGVTFYENDIIVSDSCHSCKCSRGSKVCVGAPCSIDVPDVSSKRKVTCFSI